MSQPEEKPGDNFDLLRELIAGEFPDRLSLFDQCSHRFRRLNPDDDVFQFLIAAGFVALVLRSVPEKVAGMLNQYENRLKTAQEPPASPASASQAEPDAIRQQGLKLAGIVQRLETAGNESLARLATATAALDAATERHRKASRLSDLIFWIGVLVVVGFLGAVVGYFYAQRR